MPLEGRSSDFSRIFGYKVCRDNSSAYFSVMSVAALVISRLEVAGLHPCDQLHRRQEAVL